MENKPKRRHHLVPQFYLLNFAEEDESITTVTLPGKHQNTQAVKRTAFQNKYYSIKPEDFSGIDIKEDVFEDWLNSEFETPASVVFRKLLDENIWPLNPDDRAVLAKFIILQIMRVPSHRDLSNNAYTFMAYGELASNGRENLAKGLRKYYEKNYSEEDLDNIWETIENGTFRLSHDSTTHLFTIMTNLSEYGHFILGRVWSLVKFQRKKLITSDNPVTITDSLDGSPVGIGNAPFMLFPLSREVGLILSNPDYLDMEDYDIMDIFDGKYDNFISPTTILHKNFIQNTIDKTRKYIYCHPDDVDKLPKNLPEPEEPRNFQNESRQFIEIGKGLRNNKKL